MVIAAGPDPRAADRPMPSPLAWYEASLSERMTALRQGVPAHWLRHIETSTGIPRSALCRMLGLKLSTINRKLQQQGLLNRDESERLMALHRLLGLVDSVMQDCSDGQAFDSGRWLAAWLQRPNRALGNAIPASFLDTADGREQISQLIGAQRSGSYM